MNNFFPSDIAESTLNNMRNGGSITTPPEENFDTDALRGSMQQILSENLGQYVVCEFLIGTTTMTRKEGILYSVGRSFIVLYEEVMMNYIVCDIFSIKFVTFYLPGRRPRNRAAGNSPQPRMERGANGTATNG